MTDPSQPSPGALTPALWSRIAAALDGALDLEGTELEAYLESVGATDPVLRSQVEDLLAADSRAEGFLEEAAGSVAAPILGTFEEDASASRDDLFPEDDVPPYRIERRIGQGGMGSVYLANRTDGQFEQRIALKVIKRGMDTEEITRRFLVERQILAGLEHPNIARLLDGGVTPDGRPFFAMEYVDGKAITEYADERRLTVVGRLVVFVDVCAAVRYAQQHLIVHRDLKPSNVLVTPEGVVKLLDFGVAKLLGGPEEGTDDSTRTGVRPMTPEYAAPEQLRGEPVTTATDVYALGALLYELLSGRRPHGISQNSPLGIAETILTRAPIPLSRSVLEDRPIHHGDGTRTRQSAEEVAGARRSSPRSLARQLSGDLSVIVEKALQTDPSDRYPSADALLGDLERYRAALPILARRPSIRYRVGRHLRRHRLAATLVGLIVVALGVGYFATIHQAAQTRREAQRATLVKDFLLSLFADADPNVTGGKNLTATQLLERGADRVTRQLTEEPEVQVELLEAIGSLYRDLGEYDSARPLFSQAARIQADLFGNEDVRVARCLNLEAGNELLASNLVAADSLLQRALALGARGDQEEPQRGEILGNLASLRRRSGDYDEAGRLYLETIRIDRAHYGSDHLIVATDLSNYAVFLDGIGHPDSAEVIHREVLAIRLAQLPRRHSDVARSMANLAEALRGLSRFAEADSLYRESIAIRRQLYRGAHPDLANSLRALAGLQDEIGNLDEASVLLQEALTMSRELLGDDHVTVANCYNQMGVLAYQKGDYAAVRRNMREALAIWERTLPPEHATLWTVRGNLAAVEMLIGDPSLAEAQFRDALAFHRKALGASHPQVASDLNNLGVALRLQGRAREAIEYHREALSVLLGIREPSHGQVLFGRYLLAVALSGTQEYAEAEEHLRETLPLAEAVLPAGHRTIIDLQIELGRLLVTTGRAEEAHPILVGALEQCEPSTSVRPTYRTGEALTALGSCLLALDRGEEAESLLVRGHGVLSETLGPDNVRTTRAARELGRMTAGRRS